MLYILPVSGSSILVFFLRRGQEHVWTVSLSSWFSVSSQRDAAQRDSLIHSSSICLLRSHNCLSGDTQASLTQLDTRDKTSTSNRKITNAAINKNKRLDFIVVTLKPSLNTLPLLYVLCSASRLLKSQLTHLAPKQLPGILFWPVLPGFCPFVL